MSIFVVIMLLASGFIAGRAAFNIGLSVKYWTVLGMLLGPLVYPLFNAHKNLSKKRIQSEGDISFFG